MVKFRVPYRPASGHIKQTSRFPDVCAAPFSTTPDAAGTVLPRAGAVGMIARRVQIAYGPGKLIVEHRNTLSRRNPARPESGGGQTPRRMDPRKTPQGNHADGKNKKNSEAGVFREHLPFHRRRYSQIPSVRGERQDVAVLASIFSLDERSLLDFFRNRQTPNGKTVHGTLI